MKSKDGPPKLITHRWNLTSVDELLDWMLPKWSLGNHPDFSGADGYERLRAAFSQFAGSLLSGLTISLEKAAGKGISEALALMRDPDYYETVKRRRKADRARSQKWREESEKQSARYRKEQERRKRCELTETERLHELGQIVYQLNYHQEEIQKLEARKAMIERTPAIAMVRPPNDPDEEKIDSDTNGDWPDTISFD